MHSAGEAYIPVTGLSASLLTSWLFPDKYSCPLDSTPLSSRIMANYQEAACWKDAARNYICLQTVLRFKHVLWKKKEREGGKKSYLQRHNGSKEPKVPSKNHVTVEKCLSHDEHENWFIYLFYSFSLFLPKSVYRDANETWSIKACRQCWRLWM